jgi:hypothetical protein
MTDLEREARLPMLAASVAGCGSRGLSAPYEASALLVDLAAGALAYVVADCSPLHKRGGENLRRFTTALAWLTCRGLLMNASRAAQVSGDVHRTGRLLRTIVNERLIVSSGRVPLGTLEGSGLSLAAAVVARPGVLALVALGQAEVVVFVEDAGIRRPVAILASESAVRLGARGTVPLEPPISTAVTNIPPGHVVGLGLVQDDETEGGLFLPPATGDQPHPVFVRRVSRALSALTARGPDFSVSWEGVTAPER